MNKHIIKGRLVRNPEFTPRPNSESSDRVKFTVAVGRKFGDETDFIDCICFGKRAAVIDKWFVKGQEILLQGEGQLHKWQTKDGQNRVSYSIVVEDFEFCGSKSKDEKPAPATEPADSFEQLEEDMPF